MNTRPPGTVSTGPDARVGSRSLRGPGILLGLGLGGFVDGILFHQILQWHNMLSATDEYPATNLENLRVNMVADGLFHLATWIMVVAGIGALWSLVRSGRPWTWRSLLGWMLVGWGIFNLVEGLIDHHLLQIHRVRGDAANPLLWDVGFLVFGAMLVLGGWALQRGDRMVDR